MCAEGLSLLFWDTKRNKTISGFRVARHAYSIMHLFFADVSMVFFNACDDDCLAIKDKTEPHKKH